MAERWRVGLRKDLGERRLQDVIRNQLSLDAREALLVEKEKLSQYGPEGEEITEVLNARYELFWRELVGIGLFMGAVHDVTEGKIILLVIANDRAATDLYGQACQALRLTAPARELR